MQHNWEEIFKQTHDQNSFFCLFLGPSCVMGKRDKQWAAARAHAGPATIQNITGNWVRLLEPQSHVQPSSDATDSEPDVIDDESDGEEGDWSDDDDSEPEQLD
jgi:hypothetical protein